MVILGIETSCDETAAAILRKTDKNIEVLSNVIASSAKLQSEFGGIIPEQAAREQLKFIIPVIKQAINESRLTINDIDAIAVTQGPGLIGSLLIGVETAKTLALVLNKPLVPINHLIGHFYGNWIPSSSSRSEIAPASLRDHEMAKQSKKTGIAASTSSPRNDVFRIPTFPIIGLLVSGGHSDLVLFTDHNEYEYLGGTRDDAAGECFDKCARLMNLPYPGGPEISKLAAKGKPSINLPKPMVSSGDFDFSFSGLKTAVSNFIKANPNYNKNDLAASIQSRIIESLVKKTTDAAKKHNIKNIMIAGGVAANVELSRALRTSFNGEVFSPSHNIFCTDNAAMIASAAFFVGKPIDPLMLQANPNLSLTQ